MIGPARTLASAAAAFALFSFLLNFVWEMLQTPFFAGMPALPHWDMTLLCLWATIGDVGIALAAFAAAALFDRRTDWILRPSMPATVTYLAIGVLATVLFESYAIATGRWTYSGLMPVLYGIGLVPLLQWVALPPLVLVLTRRHVRGARLHANEHG